MSYAVQDKYLLSLPSPFEPLSEEEKAQDWGKEIQIGFSFAHELDLYQAITAFKRAEFLLPPIQVAVSRCNTKSSSATTSAKNLKK